MARLNRVEMWAMQFPLRRTAQKYLELPTFESMLARDGVDLVGSRILEVGCGSGFGLALLEKRFRPSRLVGFDLMPEQIAIARARDLGHAELRVGDVCAIDDADGSYDAVFVFGILHHVPAWRDALREIGRVLRPGGVLLIEELEERFVSFSDRYLMTSHPVEARFSWPMFREGLRDAGFDVVRERSLFLPGARSFLARRRG
jgi:SAM-dependent methyltransferase